MSKEADEEYVYETQESLHMYLGLHYPESGIDEKIPPIFPHDSVPTHGLAFPQRVARLLVSLLPPAKKDRALDMGCAVGGSSFELAKSFDRVDAFDYSHSFVAAAKQMQAGESINFKIPVEADLYRLVEAKHGKQVTTEVRERVNFVVGDACNLSSMVAEKVLHQQGYDGVIMSNLLCRLPDPLACLNDLPTVMQKDGVVVIVTPFSWLTEFTHRSKWLGGFRYPKTQEFVHSKDVLQSIMESNGFEKICEEQMPLIIREHQRKYQYIISEATGWRRTR